MPAWVVPAAIAAGGALINMFQGWRAKKANEGYIRQQNAYNSPRSQMARYQAAGLNPALIYSQGNAGNQSQALSQPEGLQNTGTVFSESYNRSSLAQSQVAVQRATIAQKEAITEVNKLQAQVLEKNPMLDSSYVNALVNSMIATANDKMSQANVSNLRAHWEVQNGWEKMDAELRLLEQKFDLGTSDQRIKAEVVQSKEFQNAISEIQLKFLRDFEVNPGHILEFVKLLLLKIK